MSARERRSWEDRRKRKLRYIGLCFCFAAAGFAVILAHTPLPAYIRLDALTELGSLVDKVLPWGKIDEGLKAKLANDYPDVVSFCFGFVVLGTLASVTRREWFHDRFVSSFNDDVLIPITRQRSTDRNNAEALIVLPWQEPTQGGRLEVWKQLDVWCKGATSPRQKPLQLAVLVGGVGSGKSRTAAEFARELGRRKTLGGAVPAAGLYQRFGFYLRRVFPTRRRQDDPWDAGLVCVDASEFEGARARLAGWSPRQATLLVLDDPLPGWCEKTWAALHAANAKKRFAHPVCLLIVNQTVPPDSGIEFSRVHGGWVFDEHLANPQPITITRAAWLTADEVRTAAMEVALARGNKDLAKILGDTLFRVTEGNPLLVQLATEYLLTKGRIEGLASQALATARAERILDNLEHHGIKHGVQFGILALATLVGGCAKGKAEAMMQARLGVAVDLPEVDRLRGCFPSEPLIPEKESWIPPVRPMIVARAFLERVFDHLGEARACLLIGAAFAMDPAPVIRMVGQSSPDRTRLTAALLAVGIEEGLPGDPIDIAIAYATLAAVRVPDGQTSQDNIKGRAIDVAQARIARLSAEQRQTFCTAFASICGDLIREQAERCLDREIAVRLMLDGSTAEAPLPSAVWRSFFALLKDSGVALTGNPGGLIASAKLVAAGDDLVGFISDVEGLGDQARIDLRPLWDALLQLHANRGFAVDVIPLHLLEAFGDPHRLESFAVKLRAAIVKKAAPLVPPIFLATALRMLGSAWAANGEENAPKAGAAAEEVKSIARPYPDDQQIQLEWACARRMEAFAWSKVEGGKEANAARAAANEVAAIGQRFLDNQQIQREWAYARRHEAFAWSKVEGGKEANAARVAADEVAAVGRRFPDDQQLPREWAEARRHEAFAWSKVEGGKEANATRAAANEVAAIGQRFLDNQQIQLEWAYARRHEAFAWSNVGGGKEANAARVAADEVVAVGRRFLDDQQIQHEWACARRMEAFAWSNVEGGKEANAARAAANEVAAVGRRFPDNQQIQSEWAEARRTEAWAWSNVKGGKEANAARAAANEVAAVGRRFPDNQQIQSEWAEARRMEAFAWSNVEGGKEANAARAAADAVKAIGQRFLDNPRIQLEWARARHCEANAWASIEMGMAAVEVRTCAEEVHAIAERLKGIELQRLAIETKRYEVSGWYKAEGGAENGQTRGAFKEFLQIIDTTNDVEWIKGQTKVLFGDCPSLRL